jgi:molybdopterin-binding protein
LVEVVVDIGVRIVAAVTPGALVDLGIEPGVDVGVAVKAAAITIVST